MNMSVTWDYQNLFFKLEGRAEQIAASIAEQIIQGELTEGERIQEVRMAQSMSVSRGSVREAMCILKRSGLIQLYPRRGAVVSECSQAHLRSLFQMLLLLSTEIVTGACQLNKDSVLHELNNLKARLLLQQRQARPRVFFDEIFAYLLHLVSKLTHPYLHCMYSDALPAIRRSYFYTLDGTNCKLEQEYAMIGAVIDAIMSNNSHQAALFMQDFCRHLSQLVQESLAQMKQVELAWAYRSAY
jgi:DNA-binding GntR family transcriptional regulator